MKPPNFISPGFIPSAILLLVGGRLLKGRPSPDIADDIAIRRAIVLKMDT